MLNQKLLIIASTLAALVASNAFAKTEGNYAGLSVIDTETRYSYTNKDITHYPKFSDNSVGVGLDYRYAFNYNNFYVAPGLFFDQIGSKARDLDNDSAKIKNRYGIKADIGYDITDNFSAYFTNGWSRVNYVVRWANVGQVDDSKNAYYYGAGIGYNLNKQVAFNLEYNFQNLYINTPSTVGYLKVDTDINVIKLGASYRF